MSQSSGIFSLFLLGIGAASVSWLLTWSVRRFMLNRDFLTHPNHRSSHQVPTPTSGGWGFVLVMLGCGCWVLRSENILIFAWMWIGSPLLGISLVGGLDDQRPLSVKLRLALHFLGALLVVAGGLMLVKVNEAVVWSWVVACFGVVGLVWLVNLYNFMDGIDGIAATQAVLIVGSWWLVSGAFDGQAGLVFSPPEQLLGTALVGAMVGFLLLNWAPAKIFMGDIGSNFLGFGLGSWLLIKAIQTPEQIFALLLPMSVFLTDATYTLVRRMFSGQAFMQAHRSHTYQILSRRWGSHAKVVLAMVAYNGLWLFPLAIIASWHPLSGPLSLFAGILPILILANKVGAGLIND